MHLLYNVDCIKYGKYERDYASVYDFVCVFVFILNKIDQKKNIYLKAKSFEPHYDKMPYGCANKKGTDQPSYPCSLIGAFLFTA